MELQLQQWEAELQPTRQQQQQTGALCASFRRMMVSTFSFKDVHDAYLSCRRGKRGSLSALEFEVRLEENLFSLTEELQAKTYQPGPSVCFVTRQPKYREIFAASFRDRIVHHVIVSRLEPMWESSFIHDSYACRKGKGTHAAVNRLQSFFRKASSNGTRRCSYLHADVRSFFVQIDKQILLEALLTRLRKRRPGGQEDLQWLLERVVLRDPTTDAQKKGQLSLFDYIPEHKSLYSTGNRTGLPIGNYTSQFFANVYLDALDQFAKHKLKIPHYLRYVDDVVMVANDRDELEAWEKKLGKFLSTSLKLTWNEKRRKIASISAGCDFLGYIVHRDRMNIRRRTVSNCQNKLANFEHSLTTRLEGVTCYRYPTPETSKLRAVVASYDGQFTIAGKLQIWRRLLSNFQFLSFYLRLDAAGWWIPVDGAPRAFPSLRSQFRWFARRFSGCLMAFQIAGYYEFFGTHSKLAAAELSLGPGRVRAGLGIGVGILTARLRQTMLARIARELPVAIIEQQVGVAGNLVQRKLSRLYIDQEQYVRDKV